LRGKAATQGRGKSGGRATEPGATSSSRTRVSRSRGDRASHSKPRGPTVTVGQPDTQARRHHGTSPAARTLRRRPPALPRTSAAGRCASPTPVLARVRTRSTTGAGAGHGAYLGRVQPISAQNGVVSWGMKTGPGFGMEADRRPVRRTSTRLAASPSSASRRWSGVRRREPPNGPCFGFAWRAAAEVRAARGCWGADRRPTRPPAARFSPITSVAKLLPAPVSRGRGGRKKPHARQAPRPATAGALYRACDRHPAAPGRGFLLGGKPRLGGSAVGGVRPSSGAREALGDRSCAYERVDCIRPGESALSRSADWAGPPLGRRDDRTGRLRRTRCGGWELAKAEGYGGLGVRQGLGDDGSARAEAQRRFRTQPGGPAARAGGPRRRWLEGRARALPSGRERGRGPGANVGAVLGDGMGVRHGHRGADPRRPLRGEKDGARRTQLCVSKPAAPVATDQDLRGRNQAVGRLGGPTTRDRMLPPGVEDAEEERDRTRPPRGNSALPEPARAANLRHAVRGGRGSAAWPTGVVTTRGAPHPRPTPPPHQSAAYAQPPPHPANWGKSAMAGTFARGRRGRGGGREGATFASQFVELAAGDGIRRFELRRRDPRAVLPASGRRTGVNGPSTAGAPTGRGSSPARVAGARPGRCLRLEKPRAAVRARSVRRRGRILGLFEWRSTCSSKGAERGPRGGGGGDGAPVGDRRGGGGGGAGKKGPRCSGWPEIGKPPGGPFPCPNAGNPLGPLFFFRGAAGTPGKGATC